MMDSYCIRDRETGTIIDTFPTADEVEFALKQYEDSDEEEGIYTPDFYEICEKDKDGWHPINQ